MICAILDDGYGSYEAERAILSPLGVAVALRPCRGGAARVACDEAAMKRVNP